jgi:adenylate cyclase
MIKWTVGILPTARDILGRSASALPPAVEATIKRQDRSSEVLVRLIQLGIVLFLGTLYLVSPKTDAATAFRVVPYVLALYLALTVFGLIWSLRRELPTWAVLGSILIDITVLMLLIWSFHLQYGQPASFYLKVPTFLYVFIFIALRALRFEPWLVLSAGLIASAGWIAMVAYVALSGGMGGMITRDYVHYLTSNSVLIGAEIDKIASILIVTAILWLALRRARGLLVTSVTEQAAAENLSRFFDAPVALQIRDAEGDALSRGMKRDAAILFVDLRGFTRMAADLEPRDVIALLGEYQRRVVPLIQARHGTIDKFLGDGIMATFGAVHESRTERRDALEAVDAIMADAASWPASQSLLAPLPPQPVGAAVAAGTVVFGTVGDGTRLEFTVIGPAVNLAAKLEKQNKVLRCRAMTTREVFEAARSQGYVPDGPVEVVSDVVEGTGESYDLVVLHR